MFIELLVLPADSLRGGEGRAWPAGPPGATCGEERPGTVGATEGRGAASFPPSPGHRRFPTAAGPGKRSRSLGMQQAAAASSPQDAHGGGTRPLNSFSCCRSAKLFKVCRG